MSLQKTTTIIFLFGLTCAPLRAAYVQQGDKFLGTGGVGSSGQGASIAIAADGNTAIAGVPGDNTQVGAAWIYIRINGVWQQQGNKLVGSLAVGKALQGASVSISTDGNTAIFGGYGDNSNAGAAWVFTRTNGTWTQQGSKLVGTGATGSAYQGYSVALSGDGNTALVGGFADNAGAGATWVFTRDNGVWSQQGQKLVGTGAVGTSAVNQGSAVALSADGNTALIGGYHDANDANSIGLGAVWVFTRSGTTWTQQGNKLVGTGITGPGATQGESVALSADGNTALV